MLKALLTEHFITLFLVVLYGFKLHGQKKSRDVDLRFFWMTLICCLLLVVQNVLENMTAEDESLKCWRILLSGIGFSLRPAAALSLLLVVCPRERRSWKLAIPCFLNVGVNLAAFFTPIVFYFTEEDYAFRRGPLGYFVFAVGLLYLILILVMTLGRFYEGKPQERWILIACAVGCIAATGVDVLYGGTHLLDAIMISSVFFFMYLRSHDNYLDQLTSLRNRFAFYDDVERLDKAISAVASIDMNGLKELNDSQGHEAGDHALVEIGKCLNRINDRNTTVYRVGGDEFVVLFVRQEVEQVERTLLNLKNDIARIGYSVSTGFAMKPSGESLESALSRSDREMYRDKAEFYRQSDRDRRAARR